jgi:hypothetical protein
MIKVISTSTNKACVVCKSFRRFVSLVENVGPMCAGCVAKS